ncbi:MAG TPA: TraB/GumN family protein [Ginsengibacter sp.]
MKTNFLFKIFLCLLVFISVGKVFGQKIPSKKYQSLLWEISGNGLKHPSYLFGTMHVSSKMVFHLADSFYYALKNVDAVALEINPASWQKEMVNLDRLQHNYKTFIQATPNDYLNEKSFQLENYEDKLRDALQSEPTVVNNLLYRTYKSKEDFEEDTFLDLYIYQTAKKLGKITTGVEDYLSTERLVLEAYADMAKEKKKSNDNVSESPYEIEKKVEDAYRRGDLDLLDSLENILEGSKAFREKFLLKRNEIQANSIDTILKKNSLFVGVGAAHLPGDRGVIELLRKKGYKLRPVELVNKNAFQQNPIDKQKVPVNFYPYTNPDGAYTVSVPGNLYKMSSDFSGLDRSQYADMSNGTYYIITRVQTYSAFGGKPVEKIYKEIDSLLYENIPGKIIEKKSIRLNGYDGFDITNKTRRGDIQRYQIYVTPFEVLIFKMSGKEAYVAGPEADKFFGSIGLPENQNQFLNFEPPMGGFKINLPQHPHQFLNTTTADDIDRWEYQAVDREAGNSFLLLKKTVNNFGFLDEDTFDLDLVNESFKTSKFIQKQISATHGLFKAYPCMDVTLKLNDSSYIKEKIIINGPQYFLLAAKGKDSSVDFSSFFSSFEFVPFKYAAPKFISDTFLHFTVLTSVAPELDENFRALLENISSGDFFNANTQGSYWPGIKNALFKSDSTGEIISVAMRQFPKYYQIRNRNDFLNTEINDYLVNNDMVLSSTDSFAINKNLKAYSFTIRDTNTSRSIKRIFFINKDRLYRLAAMGDTTGKESAFVKTFLSSFSPIDDSTDFNVYVNKNDIFFKDFYNRDSLTHLKSLAALPNIYYTLKDIPQLSALVESLQYGDKDYFDTKSKAIREFGYIQGPGAAEPVVKFLKHIYEDVADTSTFQNNVIKALAKNETKESYSLLKSLLIQDPPLFENSSDYSDFFDDIQDSLLLAKKLFPEILQLLTIEDYKDNVTSLLVSLVDSNLITAKEYQDFFTKIYFDAKIELKKQQTKDEKAMRKEGSDDDNTNEYDLGRYSNAASKLDGYAKLLMPFYNKNTSVAKFIDKLFASKDAGLQLSTTILLLRNKINVPDSILLSLAKSDKYRADFYEEVKKNKLEEKFPMAYRNQQEIAKSILVNEGNNDMDSVQFVSNTTVDYNGSKGLVYFFKYRVKKDDDWKMGISGIQPLNKDEINTTSQLTKLTDKKINDDESVDIQFQNELYKMLILSHKSGRNFYLNDSYKGFDNE